MVIAASVVCASTMAAQGTPRVRLPSVTELGFDASRAINPPDVPRDVRSWPSLSISEFQDGQRFDSAGTYGAFVRAFAAPNFHVTQYPLGQWFPAGVVLVDTWTSVVDRDYTVGGASPVGTSTPPNIKPLPAWDVYTNLGLVAGWNCVYMKLAIPGGRGGRRGGSGAPAWTAIIGRPSAIGCTLENNLIAPVGKTLAVTPVPTANPNDVIAVARIIEMPGWKRAFGFRCGSQWCVFGAPAIGMPAPVHASAAGAKTHAQWTLPAWFDEQRLSIAKTPGATLRTPHPNASGLRPITTRATVIPDTGLARYTQAKDYAVRDVPVATVYFPEPPEGLYKTKWRFKMGFNQIYLRFADGKWKAYVDGDTTHHELQVRRMDHHAFFNSYGFFPATARWAWVDFDDAVWISCDVGCCYIDPI